MLIPISLMIGGSIVFLFSPMLWPKRGCTLGFFFFLTHALANTDASAAEGDDAVLGDAARALHQNLADDRKAYSAIGNNSNAARQLRVACVACALGS